MLSKKQKKQKLDYLSEQNADHDPFLQFARWFSDAVGYYEEEANAMILSTADEEGKPSARVVLMKEFSSEGFVFYTNYLSRKGNHISFNPNVALLFYWPLLERQVRIEGQAGMISETESDTYFKTRPRENRLGTFISPQSEIIPDRNYLEQKLRKAENRFHDDIIPRPAMWGGYRVKPAYFEFWQGRTGRLHDRLVYKSDSLNSSWEKFRLAP